MDRPGVRQVTESSGEQGKMEENVCEIICGAPTTLAVKGLMMMMIMMMMMMMSVCSNLYILASLQTALLASILWCIKSHPMRLEVHTPHTGAPLQ